MQIIKAMKILQSRLPMKTRLRGRVHRVRAVSLPAPVTSAKGEPGAGNGWLEACYEAVVLRLELGQCSNE